MRWKLLVRMVTLTIVLVVILGCQLVAVNVHQSLRQVDPTIGNDSTTDVQLLRGSDIIKVDENASGTIPLKL